MSTNIVPAAVNFQKDVEHGRTKWLPRAQFSAACLGGQPFRRNVHAFLLGLLGLLLATSPTQAQDVATLPYDRIYDAFQKAANVNGPDVRLAIAIESKNPDVKPDAVTLTIRSKGKARRLKIEPDGEIRGFPTSPALLQENPPVVSNQPKGSLRLGGGLVFKVRLARRYDYRRLYALREAGNAQLKKQAGLIAFIAPQARALQFEFFRPAHQTVTVRAKAGPQTFTADAKGNVELPLDKALLDENPPVVLSEKPSKILPAL